MPPRAAAPSENARHLYNNAMSTRSTGLFAAQTAQTGMPLGIVAGNSKFYYISLKLGR